jgi:iron complex outermembrane receptor protein
MNRSRKESDSTTLIKLLQAVLLSLPFISIAQIYQDSSRLSPVIFTMKYDKDSLKTEHIATTQIDKQSIEVGRQTTLADALNRQPGIVMQQGALNTSRITLRGIGSRSAFSTNRLRAFIEGIPLTDGLGTTSLEDIDPSLIERINVLKGPAGAYYGAGLGGAIALEAKEPDNWTNSGGLSTYVGGFDQIRTNAHASIRTGLLGINASYNRLTSDGYRENSNYRRDNFFTFAKAHLPNTNSTTERSLSFLLSYTDLKAFIPSSLSLDDYLTDPRSAADNWAAAEGFESYESIVAGTTLKLLYESGMYASVSGFVNIRNSEEPRPFDILLDYTTLLGTRWQAGQNFELAGRMGKLGLTAEFNVSDYGIDTFRNVGRNQGSERGTIETSTEGDALFAFAGMQWDQQFTDRFSYALGMSVSYDRYDIEDDINEPGVLRELSFGVKTMSSFSLKYALDSISSITAYASRGYSLPGLGEIRRADGSLNEGINAEKGWNYELGYQASFLKNRLDVQVNAYSIQIADLLVTERVSEGVDAARNSGSADHHGVEVAANWMAFKSRGWKIVPQFNFSWNQYYFDEFRENNEDFSGNQIPGIPRHVANASLTTSYRPWQLFLNLRHTGEIPLNDGNTLSTDDYFLLNAQLSYTESYEHLDIQLIGGANNIFNMLYPAQVLPNAPSFNNAPRRFFYPGDAFNLYGGIRLNFN